MRIQTLLVEDSLSLADTVVAYLALEAIDCDHAASGPAGLRLAQSNTYHAILLDISLPGMNGLDVCAALRREGVDVPVLMLTARDTLADKLAGFDAGTDDYLVKPFQLEELVARIRALAHRRSGRAKRLQVGELELDLSARTVVRAGRVIELAPAGWTLLEVLMRNSPHVVSRAELEEALWGGADLPDSDALKVHLYRLRQKVDRPFAFAMIRTVANHGVAIRGPDG
ncbi:MAG: response regulator transcription factor [Gammaproteobacteria bacterium]|nr:response regulator transcription factor [Gammaproteobacteria bacterium]